MSDIDCITLRDFGPLWLLEFVGTVEAKAVAAYSARFQKELIPKNKPHAVAISTLRLRSFTSTARRTFSDWESDPAVDRYLRARLRGVNIAISSRTMRGMITAYSWITPERYPLATHANIDQAIQTAAAQIERPDLVGTITPSWRDQKPTAVFWSNRTQGPDDAH